jgi:hypothetical protein
MLANVFAIYMIAWVLETITLNITRTPFNPGSTLAG